MRKKTGNLDETDASATIEKRKDFSFSKKNKPVIPTPDPTAVLAIPDMANGG